MKVTVILVTRDTPNYFDMIASGTYIKVKAFAPVNPCTCPAKDAVI
jgi:hypothetical protein